MKVIVVQIGARHHYAIPRMLEESGCLARLYTDSCANRGLGLWLKKSIPAGFRKGWTKSVTQRETPGVPKEKIFSTDKLILERIQQIFFPRDMYAYQRQVGAVFSDELIKWGLSEANLIYSMFGEGYEFLESAKSKGLRIAIEIFANPTTHRIYRLEREKYPDWEPQFPESFDREVEKHVARIIQLADVLLCPSDAVVNGLSTYVGYDPGKIRVVPYGCGIKINEPMEKIGSTQARRVLFAGSASLGKGIHYFADAAQKLVETGSNYEFRVAGAVTETVRTRSECRHLNFLGLVPRHQMVKEFQEADVFVLPTLAEGSASVIYEALAFGVPVITTHSAGSVVEHGVEGLIVPERDSQALADAIYQIVDHRNQRERFSNAACKAGSKYSEELWKDRLVAALQDSTIL